MTFSAKDVLAITLMTVRQSRHAPMLKQPELKSLPPPFGLQTTTTESMDGSEKCLLS